MSAKFVFSLSYAVIAFGCASCPKITCGREGCGTEFCYHCKQLWHPNQTCDSARQQRAQTLRLRSFRSSSLSYSQESGAAGNIQINTCARMLTHICTFSTPITLLSHSIQYAPKYCVQKASLAFPSINPHQVMTSSPALGVLPTSSRWMMGAVITWPVLSAAASFAGCAWRRSLTCTI